MQMPTPSRNRREGSYIGWRQLLLSTGHQRKGRKPAMTLKQSAAWNRCDPLEIFNDPR